MTRIYHNPRCSKSRQTLELLRAEGVEPEIELYLQTPLDAETIANLLGKLGISAAQLVRRSEQDFKDNNLGRADITEDELIAAMVKHPKLIERPIVVNGKKAAIGRPMEAVQAIL